MATVCILAKNRESGCWELSVPNRPFATIGVLKIFSTSLRCKHSYLEQQYNVSKSFINEPIDTSDMTCIMQIDAESDKCKLFDRLADSLTMKGKQPILAFKATGVRSGLRHKFWTSFAV